jgi:hypothetical protein
MAISALFPTQSSGPSIVASASPLELGFRPQENSVHLNLHRLPAPACDAFSSLPVLETPSLDDSAEMDVSPLLSVLRTHIKDITWHGSRSISLPLLGTRDRDLDIKDVTFETLKLIRAWSICAPELRVVRVFAYDFEKIAVLNRIIGDFFEVERETSASKVHFAISRSVTQRRLVCQKFS